MTNDYYDGLGHDFAEDAMLYSEECAYADDATRDALIRACAYATREYKAWCDSLKGSGTW